MGGGWHFAKKSSSAVALEPEQNLEEATDYMRKPALAALHRELLTWDF